MCESTNAAGLERHERQQKRLISFDVGLKHLAFVELLLLARPSSEHEDAPDQIESIERWAVLDATAGRASLTAEALTASIVQALDDAFYDPARAHYDVVLVENQPSRKNPAMKSVQVAILAYFATVRLHAGCVGEVRLIGASRKLAGDDAAVGNDADEQIAKTAAQLYRARKARSVELCAAALTEGGRLSGARGAPEALATLRAAKKKDDLADAMLQALAFIDGSDGKKNKKKKKKNNNMSGLLT